MTVRMLLSTVALLVLLTGQAGALPYPSPENARVKIIDLRVGHPEGLPVGFWLGQWNSEHGALELYHLLRRRLPKGETAQTVDGLIREQQQQIQLLGELYASLMQPGSTELTTPQIIPRIPPSKAPWKAHEPPTTNEIAWSALDYERRALLGYESIASIVTTPALCEKAQALLEIQRRQVQTLLDLAGEPPS